MARKYQVTVNGKTYDVEVEEIGSAASSAPWIAPAAVAAPVAAAPKPAAPAAAPAAAPVAAGGATVDAPMPGKVLKMLVQVGSAVTSGQLVMVLEAMKMENEIYSPAAGTVSQIRCKEGDSVNSGDVMIVIG